ncbi:START [Musa troglodytarum]|uniref:START n=1 Tax=Musa troglodytarum TaxID=320322 RepID=A0A9E7HJT5_9LILI|nr:START [Musa troglodytarum]
MTFRYRGRRATARIVPEDGPQKSNDTSHTAGSLRSDLERVARRLFKESPHPDEKQRQQLSNQLGLSARQVKFWFQNRRTQIKAVQERHENSLRKSEIEKLREENRTMREKLKKGCCPNCGYTTLSNDTTITTEEQQHRIENARQKAEACHIKKLRRMLGSIPDGNTSPSSTCSAGADQNKSSLDSYNGFLGLEKSRILEIVNVALEELTKMATAQEPLWVRSVETGTEILNYDEYVKEFSPDMSRNGCATDIEASRETGIVFFDMPRLVQEFMDVNQWKELFPCLISNAVIVDISSKGLSDSKDGTIQLKTGNNSHNNSLNFSDVCRNSDAYSFGADTRNLLCEILQKTMPH